MKKLLLITIFGLTMIPQTYAVSITAASTKIAIEENKLFIDFINPHITNYQTDEYFKMYKDVVLIDFEANTFFLSGQYTKSFAKILESQKILRKLYYILINERYAPDAAQMLKMSGPIILISKDKKAEYYLRTGYSYLAEAESLKKFGFGVNKFMLSQKIKIYITAITHMITAKRYAMLALVESTIPLIDKTDYKRQSYDTSRGALNSGEKLKVSEYEYLRNEIINNINKKSLPPDFPFLLHHNDNYSMIHENRKSALNVIGESINLSVKGLSGEKANEGDDGKNKETGPKNDKDQPGSGKNNEQNSGGSEPAAP